VSPRSVVGAGWPKLRLIHGYKPHQCIVFGLDPATRTGWSIFICGEYFASGVAITIEQRCDAIEKLRSVALDEELPVVVVAEDWFPGGPCWKEIAGQYEAWGRWDENLQLTGFTDHVRVQAHDWRTDIHGDGVCKPTARASALKLAKALAKARVRSSYKLHVCDDEAEAILIGEWGCRSGEVAALLAA